MKRIIVMCVLITTLYTFNSFSYGEITNKSILLLNSYDPVYTWTKNKVKGILDSLDEKFEDIDIRIEYMDTKHYNTEEHYNRIKEMLLIKYKNMRFDAIITTDDSAFEFALLNRKEIFNNSPIFFSGVNFIDDYDLVNQNNIYGSVEVVSAIDTVNLAIMHNPKLKKIYIIIDESISGQKSRKEIEKQLVEFEDRIEFEYITDKSLAGVREYVANIDGYESCIIITYFIIDKMGKVYSPCESTRLITKEAKVPIYGLYSFSFPYGIIGGKLVDAKSQGEKVIDLMEMYFRGELTSENHFVKSRSNVFKLDYNELLKYNLENKIVPKGSILINKPVTFFEKNKYTIIVLLIIIVAFIMYILILKNQIKKKSEKIKSYFKKLIDTEEELIELKKMNGLGEIVVSIAHEINTPLGSVMMADEYLKKSFKNIYDKFQDKSLKGTELEAFINSSNKSLKLIYDNSEIISQIVNDFKMIKENSEVRINKFEITHLFDEILLINKGNLQNNINLVITYNQEFEINTDKNKLVIIFNELINNSIKHGFTGDKGEIKIDISKEDGKVKIRYTDNGTGYRKVDYTRLLEPFYTVNKGEFRGLGLYKVYKLLILIGGTITVCDSNVGAEFKIEFSDLVDFESIKNNKQS